ncbi:MAG: hypothetical protein J6M40_03070 [Prevotella sp.]|nr:hypothetical protein [Prevotella sp.]
MKKTILLFALLLTVGMANATDKLYATFGSLPGGANATIYNYSWTATNNNLMTCFEFASGELANYKTLKFTLSNLTGGMVRMGYYVGSAFTEFGSGFGSNGEKTVDLTALGIDLSTVTKISFGGRTGTGSVSLTNVYLIPASTGDNLGATYGTPGSNGTFYDYTWTATSNNLWPCFEFPSGELANYTTLKFTLTLAAGSGMVRMGYVVGSTFTEFGSGFGSSGEKTVDLAALGVDLSTVTRISFGGRSGTGSANIRNVYLDNEATNRTFTPGQMSTVCLPFALTAEEAAAAGTFYELSTCDGTTVKFTEVSGATAAYTPYVFKAASANPFAALDKSCVYPVGSCTATVGSATFTGVLKDGKAPSGVYGFQSDKFVKTTSDDVSIKAFRAYLTVAAGANELTAVFGDESTGIKTMNHAPLTMNQIYDLQGRRVAQPTKGLYIINGRKVVLK